MSVGALLRHESSSSSSSRPFPLFLPTPPLPSLLLSIDFTPFLSSTPRRPLGGTMPALFGRLLSTPCVALSCGELWCNCPAAGEQEGPNLTSAVGPHPSNNEGSSLGELLGIMVLVKIIQGVFLTGTPLKS